MIWVNTSAYTHMFPVFYVNEKQLDVPIGNVTLDDLPKMVCSYCKQYNTDKILLIGNEIQLEKIKEDINEYDNLNYSENKRIEVYINEISS